MHEYVKKDFQGKNCRGGTDKWNTKILHLTQYRFLTGAMGRIIFFSVKQATITLPAIRLLQTRI
jgi:hypothetical protein